MSDPTEAQKRAIEHLEHEYARLAEVVMDAIESEPGAQSAAADLVEHVRELASSLCIKAGAGDRYDDPVALVTVTALVLMNSTAGASAGLTLIESRETQDEYE